MNKKPLLLLEVLIVFIVVALLAILGIDKYHEFFNNFPRYAVTFKDIDGLPVGAPVRFAGLHVGHVVKEELKNEKVHVYFKITKRGVEIPEGSYAGVEFTGLAGSKSLEIKPPDKKMEPNSGFQKIEPLRINLFLKMQNDIFSAILDFSNSILSFLKQNEDSAKANLKNAADYLKGKADSLEEIKQNVIDNSEKTASSAKNIKSIIEDTNKSIALINKNMADFAEDEQTKQSLETLKKTARNLNDFLESQKLNEVNENIKLVNNKITDIKERELNYINEFNASLKNTSGQIQKMLDSINNKKKEQKD